MSAFSPIFLLPKKYKPNLQYRKDAQNTFVRKSCSENVGEIDSWTQTWATSSRRPYAAFLGSKCGTLTIFRLSKHL